MTNAFDWAIIYFHFQRLLHNHRTFTIRTTIFIRLTFLQINSSFLPTRKWLRKSCFISGQNQIAKDTSCWTTGGRYKMKHWKKIPTTVQSTLYFYFSEQTWWLSFRRWTFFTGQERSFSNASAESPSCLGDLSFYQYRVSQLFRNEPAGPAS